MTREEIIAVLSSTGAALARVLAGLSEDDLRWRPDPLAWSAKEVACHMRDFAEIFSARLERMVAEEEPYVLDHDPDGLAQVRWYQGQQGGTLPAEFCRHRERTLVLLRALDSAGWQRVGVHQVAGRLTIEQMTAAMARHDLQHLEDLRALRRARGLPPA
ncbi:MAG: DinB family protein [Chloroflexi bacterium]|nr:DinB family protein [Chloroflexota bacterium]